METPKIFDSELRFCEILWSHEPIKSSELVRLCAEELGWKKSTTYTVIKKCIEKGAIERQEPKFFCKALITREQIQKAETNELINKLFDGSKMQFFSAFLSEDKLSKEEISELKELVNKLK